MNTPPDRTGPRLLLGAAALLALLALVAFLVIGHGPAPVANSDPSPSELATAKSPSAPLANVPFASGEAPQPTAPGAPATASPPAPSTPATPLARTPEGRIAPEALASFTPQTYPGGTPAYDGEPVTAYVAVPSSRKRLALTVNQMGEFPRIPAEPGEQVEVRLAFTATAPGTPVAIAARDGGKLHTGKFSTALNLDDRREAAFGFTVSENVGMHQISVTTPTGEMKTLEFWAGQPPILMKLAK
jgi:hypothetical protein